ncbi:MAG: hypothetical protein RLZZ127_101 [Planctomycetota bacterium]|jgi:NAD(P)-dependent dehydrogenase (short-subunit alcohol dehydrogenase family)
MPTMLITGGNSGIGFATARHLIAKGWTVGITGRRPDAVAQAVRDLGPKAVGFTADAGSVADTRRLAEEVRSRLGTIDSLFVNAGLGEFRPLEASDEAYYDHVMGVNLKGAYFTVQLLAPLIANPGTVVLNTSIAGEVGFPNFSVYSASKAGLRSLARTLGRELVGKGIRVNAVSPGPIDTPIYGKLGLPAEVLPGMQAGMATQVPLGRFGRADEVAPVVEFLATEASSYIVGAEIPVDGGMSQL